MKCLKITTSDKAKRNVRYPMINANARRYAIIMQRNCRRIVESLYDDRLVAFSKSVLRVGMCRANSFVCTSFRIKIKSETYLKPILILQIWHICL